MNYYEHHLGDYLRDTAHLSMIEDGAYRRLIDAYYIRQAPLPVAPREVYRLARAQTKRDRQAVDTVLREFFTEAGDGWHHGRCDEEIARYLDKTEKARASADARWAAERERARRIEDAQRAHSDGTANALRTQCDGNALQSPVTSHQSPEEKRPRKRGSRLPADWKPDEAESRYARDKGLAPAIVAEKFRNYWHAKAGNATKLDWTATWRNWCITEAERKPQQAQPRQRAKTVAELETEAAARG